MGSVIQVGAVGALGRAVSSAGAVPLVGESLTPPVHAAVSTLESVDRETIVRALEKSGWRVSGAAGAARVLGLKPTTLHSKMKKLGINRPSGQGASRSRSDAAS